MNKTDPVLHPVTTTSHRVDRKTRHIPHLPIIRDPHNRLPTLQETVTAARKGQPLLHDQPILHLPDRQKVLRLREVIAVIPRPAGQVITPVPHAAVPLPATQAAAQALPEVVEVLPQVVQDTGDNSFSETLITHSAHPAYQSR